VDGGDASVRASVEDVLYFDSPEAMAAILPQDPVRNLRRVERAFGVRASARDVCLKLSADDPAVLRQAAGFVRELAALHATTRKPVTQLDFELLLKAFSQHREGEVRDFFAGRIRVSPRKPDVVPRTLAQLQYVQAIRASDIVFGIGPAGTGKTYLAMAMAVSAFLAGRFSRIVLTRPAREAGENLGFLPGNLEEKILPYLRPLYDALYDMLDMDDATALIGKNVIEVAPLAFMRGRTLNHAFVILDEAQNTSPDQMLMFLTRLGFDSCCVITGDPSQTDLAKGQRSGLEHAARVLRGIEEINFCRFTSRDVVRHGLVEKIINAYQADDAAGESTP
jgi:phosphate starvation-inducible PhoH-like protein